MKKLLCLMLCLSLLPLAFSAAAADETMTFDGTVYVAAGENLFNSPNFGGEAGREAPQ